MKSPQAICNEVVDQLNLCEPKRTYREMRDPHTPEYEIEDDPDPDDFIPVDEDYRPELDLAESKRIEEYHRRLP